MPELRLVRFTESRVARPDPSKHVLRFNAGEEHQFLPFMQPFLDVGHAVFVDAELAANDNEPAAAARPKREALNPAVVLNGDRAIQIPDAPEPKRDPVRNGGMSE